MRETRTASPTDIAYLHLREQIVNADLMPGTFTIEYELAQSAQFEASDIRAAAARLETEGLVKVESSGGFTIAPIPVAETVSNGRQIAVLEARAAYIAAIKGPTPIGLSALADAVLTMQDALYRGDAKRWARASHHFHRSLVQCSARPRLIAAALALSESMHRARMIAINLAGPPAESADEYRKVVEAIRNGEATDAYDLHLHRWRQTTTSFLELLTKNGMHETVAA